MLAALRAVSDRAAGLESRFANAAPIVLRGRLGAMFCPVPGGVLFRGAVGEGGVVRHGGQQAAKVARKSEASYGGQKTNKVHSRAAGSGDWKRGRPPERTRQRILLYQLDICDILVDAWHQHHIFRACG